MKIKHFFDKKQISSYDMRGLVGLIEDCDIIYDGKLESVLNKDEDKSVICAYDEHGEICGFASLLDEDKDIYIGEIYVHPSSRRQGVAKELLARSMAFAKARGYDEVVLCVGYSNVGARRLYENNKFIYVKEGLSLATMKRYVSNSAYRIGGVLFEVVKSFGVVGLTKNITKIKNYQPFYKYYKNPEDEKIKKLINSEDLKYSAMLIEELFCGRTLVADMILNGELEKVVGTQFENAPNLKKSILGAKAFLDLKNHEKIKIYQEKQKLS